MRFLTTSIVAIACGLIACTDSNLSSAAPMALDDVQLSFHMVSNESSSEAAMRLAEVGKLPPGKAYYKDKNDVGLIVERRTKLTQDCLDSASPSKHPTTNDPILNFKFDDFCTELLGVVTLKNIEKRFAVVLNGEIITAPRINAPITGGAGYLEGDFTSEEIDELARLLNKRIKQNQLNNKSKSP